MVRYSTAFHNVQNKHWFNKWPNTEKKVKALRWLAASFTLARSISEGIAQPSCSTFRSFKRHRRKRSLPARGHVSIWKRSGVPFSVCGRSGRTEVLRFNLRISQGWPPTSLRQWLPVAFKIRANAPQKSRVTTRVGERFEIQSQTNVTTFKTADIFRNRSMSLCSKAHTYTY